ncbi:MAG: Protein TonB, partial [Belnapia sp.]|nr:Protein TonB [Belnapia sp.]
MTRPGATGPAVPRPAGLRHHGSGRVAGRRADRISRRLPSWAALASLGLHGAALAAVLLLMQRTPRPDAGASQSVEVVWQEQSGEVPGEPNEPQPPAAPLLPEPPPPAPEASAP